MNTSTGPSKCALFGASLIATAFVVAAPSKTVQLALVHSREVDGRFHHVAPAARLLQESFSGRLAGFQAFVR